MPNGRGLSATRSHFLDWPQDCGDRDVSRSLRPERGQSRTRWRRTPAKQNIAANPAIAFRVESFEPTESFKPTKPYQTRLKWHDQDDNEQSKLLLSKPETVIAVVLRDGAESAPKRRERRDRPARARPPRRRSRKSEASPA
jgi:hypothetical protein